MPPLSNAASPCSLRMCAPQPAGTQPNSLRSGCDVCPAGSASNGTLCTLCAWPAVSTRPGSETCDLCVRGSEPNTELTACRECGAGSASPHGTACVACSAGTVAGPGAGGCTQCSPGTAPNAASSTCTLGCGVSWCTAVGYGVLRWAMVCSCVPWCAAVCRGVPSGSSHAWCGVPAPTTTTGTRCRGGSLCCLLLTAVGAFVWW